MPLYKASIPLQMEPTIEESCNTVSLLHKPDDVERTRERTKKKKNYDSHSTTWPIQVSMGTVKQEDD